MKNNKRPPMKKGVLKRIMKILFKEYKLQMIAVAACIVMVSLASTIASLFMNKFINYIGEGLENGLDSVSSKITVAVISMLCIYALGWLASFAYTRIMAVVTQSFLHSMRKKMFDKMQSFPLRYFDSNAHGDIMSHYTNDIDAIRELVSSTLPHLMQSALIVGFLVFNMFYLSAWMALVVGFASIAMIVVAKKIGGRSAKNFMAMQRSIAKTEGFVEEMMNGQKVVKVFCHEEQSGKDFDKVNDELCKNATAANRFANILMPIMGNIGNILYVLVAFVGGMLIISSVPNVSLQLLFAKLTGDETVSALVNISVVVPFLNASK
ncbi:MAG: ABC transporter ATP-binding protein, partial [Clostridia bacterium]|nr:ABC transporter ATP-binding protein [Clostridia bacterium]